MTWIVRCDGLGSCGEFHSPSEAREWAREASHNQPTLCFRIFLDEKEIAKYLAGIDQLQQPRKGISSP